MYVALVGYIAPPSPVLDAVSFLQCWRQQCPFGSQSSRRDTSVSRSLFLKDLIRKKRAFELSLTSFSLWHFRAIVVLAGGGSALDRGQTASRHESRGGFHKPSKDDKQTL